MVGQVFYLPDITKEEGKLNLDILPVEKRTTYISVTGQDGAGKTTLRNNLAKFYAEQGNVVVMAKSPCDKHIVHLLNNAISQNGYSDWYTEQLLFSFTDGLLSNYMRQINGHCDYFICQRGPIDQYAHGVTRSGRTYKEIYNIQQPERLEKFDIYIHMNCDANTAWERLIDDKGKDRYEYIEYFEKQVPATKLLFENIIYSSQPELEFLRSSKHYYIDTTCSTIQDVFEKVKDKITEIKK